MRSIQVTAEVSVTINIDDNESDEDAIRGFTTAIKDGFSGSFEDFEELIIKTPKTLDVTR